MADNSMIWIIVAIVVALAVVAVLAIMARNKRRHAEAERIREEVGHQTQRVEKREAFAEETAATARAARAEAEVKAAEAARLEERAATHREAVSMSREELDAQRERADALDPKRRDVEQDGRGGDVQATHEGDLAAAQAAEARRAHAETPTTRQQRT